MKLCKDCQHVTQIAGIEPGNAWYEATARCAHPSVMSRVDGKGLVLCIDRRASGWFRACGPKAKQWEPKA